MGLFRQPVTLITDEVRRPVNGAGPEVFPGATNFGFPTCAGLDYCVQATAREALHVLTPSVLKTNDGAHDVRAARVSLSRSAPPAGARC